MIGFQMTNHRLDCRAPLEHSALRTAQGFYLAPVNDLHARVVVIDAAKAQIHHNLPRFAACIFKQDASLLQLFVQNMPARDLPILWGSFFLMHPSHQDVL